MNIFNSYVFHTTDYQSFPYVLLPYMTIRVFEVGKFFCLAAFLSKADHLYCKEVGKVGFSIMGRDVNPYFESW